MYIHLNTVNIRTTIESRRKRVRARKHHAVLRLMDLLLRRRAAVYSACPAGVPIGASLPGAAPGEGSSSRSDGSGLPEGNLVSWLRSSLKKGWAQAAAGVGLSDGVYSMMDAIRSIASGGVDGRNTWKHPDSLILQTYFERKCDKVNFWCTSASVYQNI